MPLGMKSGRRHRMPTTINLVSLARFLDLIYAYLDCLSACFVDMVSIV